MSQYILIIFIIEIVVLSKIDRLIYGTIITPITILSIPYGIIVLLAIFIGPSLGFVSFNYDSLWIWIFGIFIFWLPGIFLSVLILPKTNIHKNPFLLNNNQHLDKVLLKLSYIAIVILSVELLHTLKIAPIGSDNFQAAFGGGISGHTLMASRFFFIALIVKYKRKYNVPLLILLIFFISYGVKGWIFIPIISGLFIRIILRKTTLSIWFITKLLLSSFLLFYTVYRIAIGPQMPIKFVFTHFMTYIFSGPLGLSEYLKQNNEVGFDPGVIVNPLINIYNHFLGDGDLYKYKNILTNIGGDISTNTKTFFGTIYIYSGSFWGIIYTLIFGAMTYSFLIISLKTKDLIFLVIYGTILTMLFFAWFDSYTGNLFFYEFPTFGILLYLTYNALRKKNNPIIQHT